MKYIYKYLILAVMTVPVLNGCSDWLEATSSSQISDKKLFSTRTGFHEALTGVYIAMGNESCYGRNYTFYVNELAGAPYYVASNESGFSSWQEHLYNNVSSTPVIEAMWEDGYNVIANVNKILQELDERRDVITDDLEYNLIKGEMLAVRAYVHFDLMRMFGLDIWTGANASKKTVPYVTEYSLSATSQRSYADTKAMLLQDVRDALECLRQDPVTGNAPSDFDETLNSDGFWSTRTKHLNYFAVEALAARILFWAEDYTAAKGYAQDVISKALEELKVVSWVDADNFVKESSNDQRDWTFSTEQLFSLEITDLVSIASSYTYSNDKMIFDQSAIETVLFRNSGDGSNDGREDIRGMAMMLKYGGRGYSSYKFYGSSSYAYAYKNRMPMIRISEMYYLLAMTDYFNGDYTGAADNLKAVMSHRGYTVLNYSQDGSEIGQEILLEMTREFLAEGQIANISKIAVTRFGDLGASGLVWPRPAQLIYPYPVSETSYGHIQEK